MKRTILISISILLISLFLISCDFFWPTPPSTEASRNATPTVYKIAMINFELQGTASGGLPTTATIIDASQITPVVIDFLPATGTTLSDAINAAAAAELTDKTLYDNFIMVPLYIEMELKAAFHFHTACSESGYDLEFTSDGDEDDYLFRLYFNPVENYWKRDILVYLTATDIQSPAVNPTGWYWMRRVIEPGGSTNFLILAQEDGVDYTSSTNTLPVHPVSGSGPESTIDLFANTAFWGDPVNYDDYATDTVEISSITDAGGLNADWDAFTFTALDTVTVTADVTDTFNFWYETDPAKLDFTPPTDLDVIDFGPDYDNPAASGDEEKFGDWGFHPFLPVFTATSAR